MKASNVALDLIKQHEGCRLTAYPDSNGRWAIGYGQNSPKVVKGLKITQREAEEMLANHVADLQEDISRLVTVPLTQSQFDALASLVYNIGVSAFAASGLLKKLNAGDYDGAAARFPLWNKSEGVVLPGLTARRKAERDLFLL